MDPAEKPERLRTFLALPLHDYFLTEITAFRDQNRDLFEGVRWVAPSQVHITLHFFGPTSRSELVKIRAITAPFAGQHRAFELRLQGTGFFPNSQKPGVLWLGAAGDLERLRLIQHQICERLKAEGFTIDTRPFRPHATVARIRNPGKFRLLTGKSLVFSQTETRGIERIVLYQSRLSSEGSHYEILESFPFTKS